MVVNRAPAKFRGMERPSGGLHCFLASVASCSTSTGGLGVHVRAPSREGEGAASPEVLRGSPPCHLSGSGLAGRERMTCRLSSKEPLLKLLKFNGDIMRTYLFHPFKLPLFNKIITAEHVFYKSTFIYLFIYVEIKRTYNTV